MTWDPGCRSVAWPAQSANPAAAIAQPSTTGRLAPVRSSILPPICANTTKPRKKYKMSRLAWVAFSPSAICPYTLTKKNRRCAMLSGRLGDDDQRQGDERDGHIDPEDGPPGPLKQVAARDRADRGQASGDAEDAARPSSRRLANGS